VNRPIILDMNDSFGPRFPAPEHCPHCRSHNFVRIVYGLPTEETTVRAKEGEFVLGGCTLGEASWYCRSCGQRWPKERLWPTDEDALVLRLGPPPWSSAFVGSVTANVQMSFSEWLHGSCAAGVWTSSTAISWYQCSSVWRTEAFLEISE